jgi:hypothetical protein
MRYLAKKMVSNSLHIDEYPVGDTEEFDEFGIKVDRWREISGRLIEFIQRPEYKCG